MSSQWNAIEELGSDGRAFQRRISYQLELKPFGRPQTSELVSRRLATALDRDPTDDDVLDAVGTAPFTEAALDTIHERSQAVPAVITAACSQLVGLATYQYANGRGDEVTEQLAASIQYADPEVE